MTEGIYREESFFHRHPTAASVMELFEYLPGVIFYVKDQESRYVAANSAMLRLKNLRDPAELLGKSDRDFHPPGLAAAYIQEDRRVMESGRILPNQTWFVIDIRGRPGWFQSSKTPVFSSRGEVIGLAGLRFAIQTPEERHRQFRNLSPVIQHLEENYTGPVSMSEMASLAGMSSSHFNRRFVEVLGMSPTRFLQALRLEKARQLLATTKDSIGDIAIETGFYDQSHFTRHFRAFMGMTPKDFRKTWAG